MPFLGSGELRYPLNQELQVGLEIADGPFLEQGLKAMAGGLIQAQRRSADCPDRERLAIRFEQFNNLGDN